MKRSGLLSCNDEANLIIINYEYEYIFLLINLHLLRVRLGPIRLALVRLWELVHDTL